MSYDKDVNVKLEDVNNSTNISLSIPMEYLWNKLSEDDLFNITKMWWWSIGRSVERVIKIIYPDRKISYSVDPYDKGFYIIDKDNNDDNVLIINFSDWSYSINNEKVNGKDADSYFYNIYTELNNISRERKEYIGKWINSKEENDKLKKNIKELEDRLSKYEKI